jgi:hypothetical protein
VAFVADQFRVELVPLLIVLGLAARVTVGAGDVTETVADCVALPPEPVQVKPYVAFAVSAPVACDPLIALAPDQAPEAEHDAALLLDHVSVELAPDLTVLGLAVRVTTAGVAATVTVADWVADPPGPVHVSPYSLVLVSAPVDQVPLVATAPLHAPEAEHACACVEDHVSEELPPLAIVVGVAVSCSVGEEGESTTTFADCEPVPPAPVQVNVKLVSDINGAVEIAPLIG